MRAAMLPAAIAFLALGAGHAAARHFDLEHPVRDCRPCIFSPGQGAPDFEIVFKFEEVGEDRQLVAFSVRPVGGGVTRIFDLPEPLSSKDFPDGFYLLDDDLNFDGFRDLGLTLARFTRMLPAVYWVYDPKKHRLATLERVGDDNSDALLAPVGDGSKELFAHEPSSAVEHVDYWYRVSGATATAIRRERQFEEGGTIVRLLEDLTADPPRLLERSTGFLDDDERREFLRRVEPAARQAAMLYRAGDKAGAVSSLKPLLADKILDTLYDKPGNAAVSRLLNDYGFYLAEAGDPKEAVEVLDVVLSEDPDRVVAYLDIADAQFALGRLPEARVNYRRYRELMTREGKADKIPPRVGERAK
jgi:tetratricopeptide (TPR) repeat protein